MTPKMSGSPNTFATTDAILFISNFRQPCILKTAVHQVKQTTIWALGLIFSVHWVLLAV